MEDEFFNNQEFRRRTNLYREKCNAFKRDSNKFNPSQENSYSLMGGFDHRKFKRKNSDDDLFITEHTLKNMYYNVRLHNNVIMIKH